MPVLLDLFAGGGAASVGYHRAGFDVIGVDQADQPNYPFEFVRADALQVLNALTLPTRTLFLGDKVPAGWGRGTFDAIHASPPCQGYMPLNSLNAERYGTRVDHALLIEPVRRMLRATGLPYVIENVAGAPLDKQLMLCGSMFGLNVRRHRHFESNCLLMGGQLRCAHTGREVAVYGKLDGRLIWQRTDGTQSRAARTLAEAQAAMGVDWLGWDELKEAVPPPYTEHIGRLLLSHVR